MSITKRKIVFVIVSTLMARGASAADLADHSVPSAPSYDAPGIFSWAGAYAGLHGGVAAPKFNPFNNDRAPAVGAQVGYNFQAGPGVFGAELEGSYLNNEVRVPGGKVESRFRGAAKAKAGLGLDRTFIYGTAGVTTTEFEGRRPVFGSDKWKSGPESWKQGYLFGGGVEHAFPGGVSAKIEYNYVINNAVPTPSGGVNSGSDLNDSVIKAGINFRF
ncbi:porin family protein [Rhizobium leguminosarum bv. viciae]|uniref:outer membrane protein n=1 Tax=Rhizobium TaxID=379 RepID=UPI00098FF132|nr:MULTISPECIES: outer membrane protein [Rhizobium]MBB4346259.1 outer membrane immunogenic protein [Rhizobium leguminosarum]MBB5262874.1 outer membrane immunogenic protein [Rhizobium leguminosarum]MBB6299381.1 outer membrane immunogenic protein [Rhizobium leguminosarum]MDX5999961.1 outer membrane protein [Rhizobium leguminosarum]NEI25143.1 outer membrane beta-barrel protein [Rhizobium ruizarguesonis]